MPNKPDKTPISLWEGLSIVALWWAVVGLWIFLHSYVDQQADSKTFRKALLPLQQLDSLFRDNIVKCSVFQGKQVDAGIFQHEYDDLCRVSLDQWQDAYLQVSWSLIEMRVELNWYISRLDVTWDTVGKSVIIYNSKIQCSMNGNDLEYELNDELPSQYPWPLCGMMAEIWSKTLEEVRKKLELILRSSHPAYW